MNLEKSDGTPLSCENCGTVLSTETASKSILSDGQVHVFCQDCKLHMLIIKDGALTF